MMGQKPMDPEEKAARARIRELNTRLSRATRHETILRVRRELQAARDHLQAVLAGREDCR